jgi:hypothetical protein
MYENVKTQMQMVNSKKMVVDYSYQRQLDPGRVKKIASRFNPCLVNEVKVSFRDGKYYIFDGQHTTAVLKLKNSGDLDISCKVFYGLTREDEASLFAQQNGDLAKKVESISKMKALYVAGDVDIVELKEAIERAGFIFDFHKGMMNNRITCCSQVYKIFRSVAAHDFFAILDVIKQAWGGDRDSLRKEIIGGVAILYMSQKQNIDKSRAIITFSKESPNSILRAGKEFQTSGGDIKYARALLRIYNKGLRGNSKLNEDEVIAFRWGRS